MIEFDIVIRGGSVVDGTGSPPRRADVAVSGDRIVAIGSVDARGRNEIDAEGHVVTPGFIDGHTHMDAQVFWNPLGTNSSWHGVTSVVMGNCGFTLAPSRPDARGLVLDNLERAEDIPASSMEAGIEWTWDSFPEYLDAVERAPKAINYSAQVGHSALRTWAMGERAFGGRATDDDIDAMTLALQEGLRAGAVGFTTSISDHHVTPDGRPVASRSTSWDELRALVDTVGQAGAGVFELALDTERAESNEVDLAMSFYEELAELAVESRVRTTFGLRRQHLREQLDLFGRVAARGGSMLGQCQSTTSTALFSFRTVLPVGDLPEWREMLALPEGRREQLLRVPEARTRLAAAAEGGSTRELEDLIVLRGTAPYARIGDIARQRRLHPVDVMIDVALEADLWQLFGRAMKPAEEEAVLVAMKHPRTVMTFSDAGAHVSMLSGADLHTTLLSHWVRERQEITLEEAVRMITQVPADVWGFRDRGVLREGMIADVNVFDADTVAPGLPRLAADLPAGALRVVHPARGFLSTIVAGQEILSSGEHTGALPGVLVRAV